MRTATGAKTSAARSKTSLLSKSSITLHLNGASAKLNVAPWATLLDAHVAAAVEEVSGDDLMKENVTRVSRAFLAGASAQLRNMATNGGNPIQHTLLLLRHSDALQPRMHIPPQEGERRWPE